MALKFACKGDKTYSKIIIKYLESKGGINRLQLACDVHTLIYYLDENNNFNYISVDNVNKMIEDGESIYYDTVYDLDVYIRKDLRVFNEFSKFANQEILTLYSNTENQLFAYYNHEVYSVIENSFIGNTIKKYYLDITDILIEILTNGKPKSIAEFNKLSKDCYDLESEAELLTKLIQISCIYNDNKYPDWSENTMRYAIKCEDTKLKIATTKNYSCCIAFDKREYAEEYLKVFEKDLEKVKYWL